jgi:hypothetical protein
MSKTTSKLALQTIVPVDAPATPHALAQPLTIVITEVSHLAFAAAAVLVRTGWNFSPDHSPEVYASTGHSTITMVKGHPDSHAVSIAEAAEAYAMARQQIDFEKEVAAAAKHMMADAEKQAKQAEIAAVIAAQKAQIAKLTAEMNAQ